MSKVKLTSETGPVPILAAYPVILMGSLVGGKPDFATLAWTGVAASIPPTISLALQHHRYSLKGVRENMVFSVNVPSTDLVKETDYCGIVSGASTDKVVDCNFTIFYGKSPAAPLIEQCPINHVCEVIQILNLGSHELVVGKILESYVSQDCLKNGRLDLSKARPFFFAGDYYALGEPLGQAFHIGKQVNEARVRDTHSPQK